MSRDPRLFIALDLISQNRVLDGVRNILVKANPEAKSEPHPHITLGFLGETPWDYIDGDTYILDRIASNYNPFSLRLTDLKYFYNPSANKHIVWAKPEPDEIGQEKILVSLQRAIQREIPALMEHNHSQFTPHVTLISLALNPGVVFTPKPEANVYLERKAKSFLVKEITLFRSVKLNGRIEYWPIHKALLGQQGENSDGN